MDVGSRIVVQKWCKSVGTNVDTTVRIRINFFWTKVQSFFIEIVGAVFGWDVFINPAFP